MRKIRYLDIECYKDYFLAKFYNRTQNAWREFECYDGHNFDWQGAYAAILNCELRTFNGTIYDIPMLTVAIWKAKQKIQGLELCRLLKTCSDFIIQENNRPWHVESQFGVQIFKPPLLDHVDLIEVAFGKGGLKLYGGRLHSRKLQELPIDPNHSIYPEQRRLMAEYCGNDLMTTADLGDHLKPQLELRALVSAGYGIDVRSKSDAQIAEAILKHEVQKAFNDEAIIKGTERRILERPATNIGHSFKYKPPKWMGFRTEPLQKLLEEIRSTDFVINPKGKPENPALKRTITIGQGIYRLGIGGLHSSETCQAVIADEKHLVEDIDVVSYYPSIVLKCGLAPRHMGEHFSKVYGEIFDRRVKAKKAGQKTEADTFKIVLNGSFGKFGNIWSVLYSPDLLIQVTVTGQLALLMLIEALHSIGIEVKSANTDGILVRCPRDRADILKNTIRWWESVTQFEMEETPYRALYARDVNNYIAIKDDEKRGTKGKGAFAEISIAKNPKNAIVIDAVTAYLKDRVPVHETVLRCSDIRKFVTVRTVRGGAMRITKWAYDDSLTPGQKRNVLIEAGWTRTGKDEMEGPVSSWAEDIRMTTEAAYIAHVGEPEYEYVGKVVRFYKGYHCTDDLRYLSKTKAGGHNKVPESDGAVPLMELPDEFPEDVDHGFYIDEAIKILKGIGAISAEAEYKLFEVEDEDEDAQLEQWFGIGANS